MLKIVGLLYCYVGWWVYAVVGSKLCTYTHTVIWMLILRYAIVVSLSFFFLNFYSYRHTSICCWHFLCFAVLIFTILFHSNFSKLKFFYSMYYTTLFPATYLYFSFEYMSIIDNLIAKKIFKKIYAVHICL